MFLTITMLMYCTADTIIAIWLACQVGGFNGWAWMVLANLIMAGFWLVTLKRQLPARAPKRAGGTTGPGGPAKETPRKPVPDFTPPASVKVIPGTGRMDVQATLDAARMTDGGAKK